MQEGLTRVKEKCLPSGVWFAASFESPVFYGAEHVFDVFLLQALCQMI